MTVAIATHRLHDHLRQMIAVLEAERRALAALDLDAVLAAAADKHTLCAEIDAGAEGLDAEAVALLESAQRLNEINRQVRNLVAANVALRLDALAGAPAIYRKPAAYARAY
jgi:hypothetical protein